MRNRKAKISVQGMTCTSCSGTVESLLQHRDGVVHACVTLATNCADIEYDSNSITAQDLVEDIESIGFEADILTDVDGGEDGVLEESKCDVKMGSLRKSIILLVESITPHRPFDHSGTIIFAPPAENSKFTRKLSADMILRVESLLESLSGVYSVQVSQRDQDADMIAIDFDENVNGPRNFCAVLFKKMGLETSVCLHGGFLLAEKMSQLQRRETTTHLRALAVAAVLSIPILVIGMLVPMSTDDISDHSPLHYQVRHYLNYFSIHS